MKTKNLLMHIEISRFLAVGGLCCLLAACGGNNTGFVSTTNNANAQVEIGSVVNGVFESGVLSVSPTTLAPGSTATVTAVLEYSNGNAYTAPTTVNFTSTCAQNKEATITSTATTNSSGEAVATYTPGSGCSGTDTIQASATVNNVNLIATATVTITTGTTAVVDFQAPGVETTPVYVPVNRILAIPFLVRSADGLPISDRTVHFQIIHGAQSLLTSPEAVSDARGLAFARLRIAPGTRDLQVLASLVDSHDVVVATASMRYDAATTSRHVWLSVIPRILNLGATGGRVSNTIWILATGADGLPLPDGTKVAISTNEGEIPSVCQLRDGRCEMVWREQIVSPRPTGEETTARVVITARLAGASESASSRGSFEVVSNRARVHLVSATSTIRDQRVDIVSVTSGHELLPAGTRIEFRAIDGRILGLAATTVPNVEGTTGKCLHGADPDRGCYVVRLTGRNASLEVLTVTPGGVTSERTLSDVANGRR